MIGAPTSTPATGHGGQDTTAKDVATGIGPRRQAVRQQTGGSRRVHVTGHATVT